LKEVPLSPARRRAITLFLMFLGSFFQISVLPSYAEWYVAGYGGFTTGGKFYDVTMPEYGQGLAEQQFPTVLIPTTGDTLSQTFKTSDLSLSDSALFGGKAGYFFNDHGFPWFGMELDVYTSTPDIGKQNVSTSQTTTFVPGDTSECLNLGTRCPQTVSNTGSLSLQESSLRVTVVIMNLIARYPGTLLQPYVGVGGGAFYFDSSGQIDGHQLAPGLNLMGGLKVLATKEWGLFVEGRYNLSFVNNFDETFGLTGSYRMFQLAAGIAYHF
jgi:hypothetical protein